MKICHACTRWRSDCEFPRDPRNSDGRAGTCRACHNARARARYVPRGTMRQPRDEAGRFRRAA